MTPYEWLWKELVDRLGETAEQEIHQEFNRRNQLYQKALQQARRDRIRARNWDTKKNNSETS